MNNPNETNTFTFQINRRRLTRMQCWIRFSFELNVRQFAGQVENRFQIAFQIIEINGLFCQIPVFIMTVTADHACQHQILTDPKVGLRIRYET